jgi:xylan 1,4-beta-xylosidase
MMSPTIFSMQLRFLPLALMVAAGMAQEPVKVDIDVDLQANQGPLKPVYSFFGYDEPNYTYMKDGRKLLSELSALSPVTVHVRVHSLLVTGDGTPALKWGSTNAYTEDASGKPVYDWTIIDRIFDTYIERKMKPLVQIGFMPEALSVKPQPYKHYWDPAQPYGNIFTGWSYPPRDYGKWAELVHQWVRHSIERYGKQEVESWWWELWNEPDGTYWQGTVEEYCKLYDYTVDAVKRAAPGIRMGGPHVTGPASPRAEKFLRTFLEHVIRGKNHVTGKTGAPIDYIGFHAKGRPEVVDNHVQMGSQFQLRSISKGFEVVASYPELKNLPIIIGESDPEGCAACSVAHHPRNAYRNGTLYSSYTAATFARKHDLAARHKVNFEGAVTWAFEFEDQPYFAGFRDLATNGIDKPVLNVFRMYGLMGSQRVPARSSGSMDLDEMMANGVKGKPDVGVLGSREERSAAVMVWNYHDDDVAGPTALIQMKVKGVPASAGRVLMHHYRIDETHSNSYTVWKKMGSPQKPTAEQYAALEAAGQLELLESPSWLRCGGGECKMEISLPRQGVSLVRLQW